MDIVFEDEGVLVAFVIDVATEERHQISTAVTEHEVERGVDITDHVRRQRDPLTIAITITDTPLFLAGEETRLTRCVDSWEQIEDAANRGLRATIATTLKTYENMVILNAHVTRRAADGTWIQAELTFVPIREVSSELVDDPVPARERDRRQVSRGAQGTEEASPRLRSIAQRSVGAVRDFFGVGS